MGVACPRTMLRQGHWGLTEKVSDKLQELDKNTIRANAKVRAKSYFECQEKNVWQSE